MNRETPPAMLTSDFRYELPEAAIAQQAIEPRHDAALLDTRTMTDHRIIDLPELLRAGDVVVVNRTRVRRARLLGVRPTGGQVEVLLLRPIDDRRWEALARPSRRLRAGSTIEVPGAVLRLVADPIEGRIVIESDRDLEQVAASAGETPLPPYFHGALGDPERYQTVFADAIGSAAAPTAGLHFTEDVLDGLSRQGVDVVKVELEIGLDTFRPIASETIEGHRMHSERVRIDQAAVDRIETGRSAGGRVIAVGTTVVRSLESAASGGSLHRMDGPTELFITPGYRFQAVDMVLTNFHVPGSTLTVLIASVLGEQWRSVYAEALRRGYRFLSFGDAMLAEVTH